MTQARPATSDENAPVLTASHAAVDAGSGVPGATPAARAVARLFPVGENHDRILMAVAEAIGDPLSAEAQATEVLSRLEATVARAPAATDADAIIDTGYAAAGDGVRRLKALPGSVAASGVALVTALIEAGVVTIANLGGGTALLRRDGEIRRLTADQRPAPDEERTRYLLGTDDEAAPPFAPEERLQPGDTLLLCSESVAHGLGDRVIEAVLDAYGPQGAADELCDLGRQLQGVTGAAVALLHVPGAAASASAVAAITAATMPLGAARPRRLLPVVLIAAVLLGASAMAGAILYASTRSDSGSKTATKTSASATTTLPTARAALSLTATPVVLASSPTPTPTPAPASPSPSPSATPGGTPPAGASPTPVNAASLPACDSSNKKPCRYTAVGGDSLSRIGDRFDLSRACFEAANLKHEPIAPRAPDYRIGIGEEYFILDPAGCAALPPPPAPPPTPQPVRTTAPTIAGAGTPTGTARPNATGTATGTATASASASATPAVAAPTVAPRAPCTPRPGEQFPRATC